MGPTFFIEPSAGPGGCRRFFDFGLLAAFCALLFVFSLRNIRRRWIL